MKKSLFFAATAIACLGVAGQAAADVYGGAAGIKVSRLDYPDNFGGIDSTTLEGRIGFDLGNQISIDVMASVTNGTEDWLGTDYDYGANNFGLRPMYMISPGTKVGIYYDTGNVDWDGNEVGGSGYGVEGSFAVGEGGAVSVFFGKSDLDGWASADVKNFGLGGSFDVSDSIMVGGHFMKDTYKDGGYELKVTEISVKGGYDLSGVAGVPVVLTLEYAKVSYDDFGPSWDDKILTLGAMYTFGDAPNAFLGHHIAGHGFGMD